MWVSGVKSQKGGYVGLGRGGVVVFPLFGLDPVGGYFGELPVAEAAERERTCFAGRSKGEGRRVARGSDKKSYQQ